MFDIFKTRLEITGTLETVTALRISAERSTEPIGTDLPVIKDAFGQPFIPGSSFKGAMRSRLESFLRGIDSSFAEDPANFTSLTRNDEVKDLKKEYKDNDEELTKELIERTDLVSRLFGSPWIASKLQVRDLTIVPNTWFDQYQERDGVSIDRDTETAVAGKLYDFQVVPATTKFEFRAVVENAENCELGLLMIGLHQFETEQIPLGGGSSRGLGVVKLDINKMNWIDVRDNPEKLLTYLQELVNNKPDGKIPSYEDGEKYKQQWTESLIDYLKKYLQEKISAKSTTTTHTQS